MTSTITDEQRAAIAEWLNTHELPRGLGTEEKACSAATINIALGYGLRDDCPDCASPAIWGWMIHMNDRMPHTMRNSAAWKSLLPSVAGTGCDLEKKRAAVALEWMWTVVLPQLQPLADRRGFGAEWLNMTTLKTKNAALNAKKAADAAAAAAAAAAADAAAAAAAAAAADAAAAAAAAADADAAKKEFWIAIDPCACLARMIAASK